MSEMGAAYGPIIPFAVVGVFFLYAAYLFVAKVLPYTRAWREKQRQEEAERADKL